MTSEIKEEEVISGEPEEESEEKAKISTKRVEETEKEGAEKVEETSERLRRLPAELVKIKNLKPNLKRVCVAGIVVSRNNELYSFVIDDGEGKVLVLLNDVDRFQKIEIGQFVRVFAKIWGEGDEIELQADVVQDVSKIDKDLYMALF